MDLRPHEDSWVQHIRLNLAVGRKILHLLCGRVDYSKL